MRAAIYRGVQSQLVKPLLLRWVFERPKERSRIFSELRPRTEADAKRSPLGWFHASSVGELEMLAPLIQRWSKLGANANNDERAGVVITIFSESAQGALEKLAQLIRAEGANLLFAGYAPWEGEWGEVLARAAPEFFVTARYEAWPELWMTLSNRKIPLLIVGARARSSLKWAKRVCGWLGVKPPKIRFCAIEEGDISALQDLFPESEAVVTGDPRWDRVRERAARGSARAREITEMARSLPRPWGVLGSFWQEDLVVWEQALHTHAWNGTLWMVPHKTDEAHLAPLEESLREQGLRFRRSSSFSSKEAAGIADLDCVVVDEMGFLAELYASADWSYVGGGFGQGVHSTIEPAIHARAVACGPRNAGKFPEIALLSKAGMLTLVKEPRELLAWLASLGDGKGRQPEWKAVVERQEGASERCLEQLLPWVSGWKLQKERDNF